MVQFVMLDTSPMPLTSEIKSGLVKVPVHFNVYQPKFQFVTKCPFGLVAEKVKVTDCGIFSTHSHLEQMFLL